MNSGTNQTQHTRRRSARTACRPSNSAREPRYRRCLGAGAQRSRPSWRCRTAIPHRTRAVRDQVGRPASHTAEHTERHTGSANSRSTVTHHESSQSSQRHRIIKSISKKGMVCLERMAHVLKNHGCQRRKLRRRLRLLPARKTLYGRTTGDR